MMNQNSCIINDGEDLFTKFEFLEHIPGIYFVIDLNITYQATSKPALQMMDLNDVSSIINKTVFDLPNRISEAAELFIKYANKVFDTKSKVNAIQIFNNANGPIAILAEESPILDKTGRVQGAFLQAIDITSVFLKNYQSLYDSNKKFINELDSPKQYILTPESSPLSLPLRQQEILALMIRGKTIEDIGKILGISPKTVEKHIYSLKENLNCNSKSQVIEKAIDSGFIWHLPETLLSIPRLF